MDPAGAPAGDLELRCPPAQTGPAAGRLQGRAAQPPASLKVPRNGSTGLPGPLVPGSPAPRAPAHAGQLRRGVCTCHQPDARARAPKHSRCAGVRGRDDCPGHVWWRARPQGAAPLRLCPELSRALGPQEALRISRGNRERLGGGDGLVREHGQHRGGGCMGRARGRRLLSGGLSVRVLCGRPAHAGVLAGARTGAEGHKCGSDPVRGVSICGITAG